MHNKLRASQLKKGKVNFALHLYLEFGKYVLANSTPVLVNMC